MRGPVAAVSERDAQGVAVAPRRMVVLRLLLSSPLLLLLLVEDVLWVVHRRAAEWVDVGHAAVVGRIVCKEG